MDNKSHSRRAAVLAALFAAGAAAAVAVAYERTHDSGASTVKAPGAAREEKLELVTDQGTHALMIEVARTPEEQALGLMYRTSLADDHGMLFPHEVPREAQMWMRNTYIPLDMVFIRADGTVHRIEKRAEPFSERIISSEGVVAGVLELAGGAADRLGLKPGDKVRHPFFTGGSAPH